jgi:hypothetical protein
MGRLRRFADYRFIGRRDQMLVYDCDDSDQFAELELTVSELRLDTRGLLSSFAPDTIAEARNRGFEAPRSGEFGPPPGS